jgi:hypothetical protein
MGKNDTEAKLILTAEDNISGAIKKISAALGESGLAQSITAVSTGFMALKGVTEMVGNAIGKVTDQFAHAIDAASEMESTNRKLAQSLMTTGEFTKESFDKIVEWSDAVEAATGMGNEMALDLVIVAKNMGMTAEQAQVAAQAAIDLGAATGQSSDALIRGFAASLQGVGGRLEKMVPEVANLTKEQLKNGDAITVIAQKYRGFAAETSNTFSGAQSKLRAQIENVYEAFGRMIVQNPMVVSSLSKIADVIGSVAKALDTFSSFVLNNSEAIKEWAVALGIVATAYGVYSVAMNIGTIATTAATVATIAYNAALAVTPWGLVIAGVAALTYGVKKLIENWELISAVVQEYAGVALQKVIGAIEFVIQGHLALVSVFSKDLAKSISDTLAGWKASAKAMEESGAKAREAALAHKQGGKDTVDAADAASMAIKGMEERANAAAQAAQKIKSEYAKALGDAQDVFEKVKDLVPSINLAKFKEDATAWENSLKDFQAKAKAMKIMIETKVGGPSEADLAELKKVEEKAHQAELALAAVKIKSAQEVRSARVREVEIELNQQRDSTITVDDEIKTKRIASFKEILEAQLLMAVDMETRKETELANIRASLSAGLGGASEASSGADVKLQQEEERQQKMQVLRQQDLLSEEQYQQMMTDSMLVQTQARNALELELANQRSEMLGLSEDGLAAKLEQTALQNELELEMLQVKYDNELITDEEFKSAQIELEQSHAAQMSTVREQHFMAEAERNKRLGKDWEATLAAIRAAQEKHGQVMGMLRGIQQSDEYKGTMDALGNLASLRNSKSKEAFEIGKKAAIAQATIKTFEAATSAYASLAPIPLVGPVLGAAAAAAAIAAGFTNIQNINAQKFSQAHGGIDEVPQSMSDKTFLLKGGERVLQSDANKDMTAAAAKINDGQTGGGHTFQITIHGDVNDSQIDKLKGAIIEVLRSESEKGTPIINEKGIARN